MVENSSLIHDVVSDTSLALADGPDAHVGDVAAKRVFIKTFGCQMNVYDSERMGEALGREGYVATPRLEDADLVILNTCHIRERAAEKVYSELGRVRQVRDERRAVGRDTVVTVAGCVAQAEGAEIVARAPVVDLVVGPQSYHRLPELIARSRQQSGGIVETAFPEEEKFDHLPRRDGARIASAFLTVQEGCDKFCTFCVVPYTRGMEYSRSVEAVVAEAEALVARGAAEITLLGQNVNGYHGIDGDGATVSLAGLVRRLSAIEGLARIRYMTSHPRDMGDDLIAAHRDEAKLMPFLHLPVQSGSDRILAAMNRKHTAAEYRSLVARIRAERPDIGLSTDIIVGFPGETEADFVATLELIEDVTFAQAYSFKYSARPGTPAARIEAQVPERVKAERLDRLQQLLNRQQTAFNERLVGQTLPVLFERRGRQSGQLIGRSPHLQSVHAAAPKELLGRIVPVEIVSAGPNSLMGVVAAR